jgi:hypothetical protein
MPVVSSGRGVVLVLLLHRIPASVEAIPIDGCSRRGRGKTAEQQSIREEINGTDVDVDEVAGAVSPTTMVFD